jgi:CheY-like chemotaxis protein
VRSPADAHQPVLLAAARMEQVADDRNQINPDDKVMLIVEDDPHYAQILLDLARSHDFKGLVATRGDDAMDLIASYPLAAVSLDIFLPDMLGWTILSHLKQSPDTRHIPVQIVTVEEEKHHGLGRGAFAYLNKSVTLERIGDAFANLRSFIREPGRRLLVIEDVPSRKSAILKLLSHEDVQAVTCSNVEDALETMRNDRVDCAVLDLRLPGESAFKLLAEVQRDTGLRRIPFVVFQPDELPAEEEEYLRAMGKSMILKLARSRERLLDDCSLFLHCPVTRMPDLQQRMLKKLYESDETLAGQKVLVVDDDVRNIFALSSILERHQMVVLTANNGLDAIDIIERTDDLALVLMDIMMPEMDGYETMRRIRAQPRFNLLPIIALTAKAMKGDREKCLEAGASEYVAKPVNNQQLVALFRTWLHR